MELEFLAEELAGRGVEIISTGGTAAHIREHGIKVTDVSERTGEREMLDGRVKTLHPAVFGGILANRSSAEHMSAIRERGIGLIDLVVVNFYPFEEAVEENLPVEDAIEKIDIGGPSMVRAAAKNHEHTVVLVDPEDYEEFLALFDEGGGQIPTERSREFARKAFALTARYDAMIAGYLGPRHLDALPETLELSMERGEKLRYGENPHQSGVLYVEDSEGTVSKLSGPDLSYNNHLDMDAAWACVNSMSGAARAAIFKHGNPCGACSRKEPVEAFRGARDADPQSAFGGVVAFAGKVDAATAQEVAGDFYELICAAEFSEQALEILAKKERIRVVEIPPWERQWMSFRSVIAGVLMQDADVGGAGKISLEYATTKRPTDAETEDLKFAWMIAKHVKSNAVVLARDRQTAGIGAGQMSRIDSAKIACSKATANGRAQGAVAASDGFLPFPDTVEVLAEAGVTALIQPGGSKRDPEVTEAAERAGIAMVLTGVRHFLH